MRPVPIDLVALLNHTGLFGDMSEKSKQAIARIAVPGHFEKNATLFNEGDRGLAVFLLANGAVQLQKAAGDGRTIVIKTVQPGEVFAEVILFEQDRYPVSAIAVRKSIAYRLPRNEFSRLLAIGDFRDDFIRLLIRKQRYLTDRIRSLVSQDVGERFFSYLREHHGERERIAPGISKKDLAAAVGTTPETLSRLIQRFGEQGLLSWKNKEIILKKGFWQNGLNAACEA